MRMSRSLAAVLALALAAEASPNFVPGENLHGAAASDVTGAFDYDAPAWAPDSSPTLDQARRPAPRADLAPTALFAPTAMAALAPTALVAPTALANLAPTAMPALLPTASIAPTAMPTLMPTAAMPTAHVSLMPTAAMPTAVAMLPTAAPNAQFSWVPSAIPSIDAPDDAWWRWLDEHPLARQYWSFTGEPADAPSLALLAADVEHVAG